MKKWLVWHPFLFGLYPILFLYARNAHQMHLKEIFIPALLALALTLVLYVIVNLFLKNNNKSAILTSILVLFFFSWRVLIETSEKLNSKNILGIESFWDKILIIILSVLIILLIIKLIRTKKSLDKLTSILNVIALILIVIQIGKGGMVIYKRPTLQRIDQQTQILITDKIQTPNIYYIITDAYARSDVLKTVFDYDNSAFITELRNMGFYVADSSHSNYAQTLLSLTSTLNLDFIDKLAFFSFYSEDRSGLINLFQNNVLIKTLKQCGYKIIDFKSGYDVAQFDEVDIHYEPGNNLSEFNSTLISYTPLTKIFNLSNSDDTTSNSAFQYDQARERILYTLDKLPTLSNIEEPCFIMAHIITPHPPFLWDEKGNETNPDRMYQLSDGTHFIRDGGTLEEYMNGYKNQIQYISQLLLKTIKEILAVNKDNPPVIILQADHGPGSRLDWRKCENSDLRERFSILNAYYLPDADTSVLYPSITPINTYRIILNEYFKTEYPLLEDRSFYSCWKRPFEFVEVTKWIDLLETNNTYLRLPDEEMSKPYNTRLKK